MKAFHAAGRPDMNLRPWGSFEGWSALVRNADLAWASRDHDKALALLSPAHDAPAQNGTPGVLEVKFVAANTFLAVPGFMNRNERGTKLLGEVVQHPLLATAPLPFRGSVWLSAAKEANKAKNTAEAKRYLDLIVQQQAPQAAQAQTLLKNLSSS